MFQDKFEELECGFCGQKYEANIYLNQGAGFAADCFNAGVIAHYGSEFDGEVFMFEQPLEDPKPFCDRPYSVCDSCISGWIAAGVLVKTYDWFDFLDFLYGGDLDFPVIMVRVFKKRPA